MNQQHKAPLGLDTLVIASHNLGKIQEMRELLEPFGLNILTASDFTMVEPEETGRTFQENALIKAKYIAQESGHWALSDDSGLCVDGLDGDPGVYTARWTQEVPGGPRSFAYGIDKIRKSLQDKGVQPPYAAEMVCVLSLVSPQGDVYNFEGVIRGLLQFPKQNEFDKIPDKLGFDYIFIPEGHDRTFWEDPLYKTKVSHRTQAFQKFSEFLTNY